MVASEEILFSFATFHMYFFFNPSTSEFMASINSACCAHSLEEPPSWTKNLSAARALEFATSSCVGRNFSKILVIFSFSSEILFDDRPVV